MKYYYIAYETKDGVGFRIRETPNNLDLIDGLQREIAELETLLGKAIVITFYKRLNCSFWRMLYEKILSRLHN